jgi:seryl-tRNA synthetase
MRIRDALRKRGVEVDFSEFLEADVKRRATRAQVETLRGERNTVSDQFAKLKREGGDVEPLRERMKIVSVALQELEGVLAELDGEAKDFLDQLPNIADDDVPAGGKEANQVVRDGGAKPTFDFEPTDHVDLARRLDLIDYERGTKLGGSGFWVYVGDGALLEWSLLNYFIEAHRRDGYTFILPPHILRYDCGYAAGQFPKFAEEVFMIEGGEQFMLPTSETALLNLHAGETLNESELPKKYFAFSPCYRKEIGGYRAKERGTLRGHQFDKVEMFQFTSPDGSGPAHHELVGKAEQLVVDLGLHYRVSLLAAEDMGAAMARTYDVEVWLPSLGDYIEVSSVSNARDYQARRANIRFAPSSGGKSGFVHTLNASGLATSRLLPAILEQHQLEDGTVVVPEVLRKWMDRDILTPE